MSVSVIRYYSGPAKKPRPRAGDRKTIRGIEHIRQHELCHDHAGRVIGYNKTGGRYHYVWVPVVSPQQPKK